jgi:hypothetical protein
MMARLVAVSSSLLLLLALCARSAGGGQALAAPPPPPPPPPPPRSLAPTGPVETAVSVDLSFAVPAPPGGLIGAFLEEVSVSGRWPGPIVARARVWPENKNPCNALTSFFLATPHPPHTHSSNTPATAACTLSWSKTVPLEAQHTRPG